MGRPQRIRPITRNRGFRSGGVELEINDLMVMTAAVTAAIVSVLQRVTSVVIIVLVVVALERVCSAGHWAGESWAVDTL